LRSEEGFRMERYTGATRDAMRTINSLFDLPARGDEQDWEIELADGKRIPDFLAVLSEKSLDIECRSALALLTLFSFTYPEPAEVTADMAASARSIIQGDKAVYERMLSHWSEGFLDHEEWVRSILS
jgi:hypothetical protein